MLVLGKMEAPRKETPLGRNFNRFWLGSMSSNLADGLMLTALPLIAAMLTSDPLLVSFLAVARYLPWLLFGLFAGAVVDRVDRVRLMVGANVLRGVLVAVLAVLVATGHATIWTLIAVMFLVMSCEVFYDLAGRAMLPAVAPSGTLERANGRLVSGQTVTEGFGGAPLAGFLFVVAAALPLAVNAGAYVLGALILLGLPLAVRRPCGPAETEPAARKSVVADIREGMGYTFGDPSLRAMTLFGAISNIGLMALNAVMVLLVKDHFEVPVSLFGVFMATTAVGAVIGGVVAGRVLALVGRFRLQVTGFLLMGLCYVAIALAPNAYVAAAVATLLGAVMTISNTVLLSVIQVVVPGHMLGRMMSCSQMLGYGLTPVGALIGGLLGRVDLRYPALFAGVVVLVALLMVLPALRDLGERVTAVERDTADHDGQEGQRTLV